MFKQISDLDIDWLRSNHTRLYYFGLGFIQLKIDEIHRLHFYTPKLPAFNEDIHNHRYDFTSHVIKGNIVNKYYQLAEGNSHLLKNESCNQEIAAPVLDQPCAVVETEAVLYGEGNRYSLTHDVFHTVKAPGPCITCLTRGDYTKPYAQIVIPKNGGGACPFSQEVAEDRLWEIIAEMLDE